MALAPGPMVLREDVHGDLPRHRPPRTGQDAPGGVTGDSCHLTDARLTDTAAPPDQVLTCTRHETPVRREAQGLGVQHQPPRNCSNSSSRGTPPKRANALSSPSISTAIDCQG